MTARSVRLRRCDSGSEPGGAVRHERWCFLGGTRDPRLFSQIEQFSAQGKCGERVVPHAFVGGVRSGMSSASWGGEEKDVFIWRGGFIVTVLLIRLTKT